MTDGRDAQNAMNASEITDTLRLHSLKQRAWVRVMPGLATCNMAKYFYSSSSRPALLPEMVSTRVWNG